jgi:hypothetical protein
VEENVEGNANTAILDELFKAMNGAIKKSLVYSPTHPMSTEARAEMYVALRRYLDTNEMLKFGVTRDSIIVEGNEYGMAAGGFYLGLAAHLHDRQITSIAIYPPVQNYELDAFFDLMAMDPNETRRQGGIEDLLEKENVQNITAKRLAVEALADEILDDLDLSGEPDEAMPPEEMFTVLREGELSPNETGKIILRLKQSPMETAKLFVRLSDIAATDEGDPSLEGRAAYVAGAIEKIASVAGAGEGEEKAEVFANIASALTSLSDDFKSPIMDMLEDRFGQMEFGPELKEALAKAMSMAAEQTAGYHESGEVAETKPSEDEIRLSPEEVYYEFSHFYDELPPQVTASVEEEIAAIEIEDVEEQAIETLVEMLINTEDEPRLIKTLKSLSENVSVLFAEGRLELAAKSMKAMRIKGQELQKTSPELVTHPRDALVSLANADNLGIIMNAAMQDAKPDDKKYGRAMLDMLGPGAVPGMLAMVGHEANAEKREKLIKITAHLSKGTMEIFERRLQDPDDKIIRAVIWVAGEFEEPKGSDLLKRALRHENEEIRIEAIRQVTAKHQGAAAKLIMPLLDDVSERVRDATFQAIGKLKIESAVPKLISMAEERDFFFKNIDARLKAIATLGAVGSPQSAPALEKLSKGAAIRKQARTIKAAAAQALEQVSAPNSV